MIFTPGAMGHVPDLPSHREPVQQHVRRCCVRRLPVSRQTDPVHVNVTHLTHLGLAVNWNRRLSVPILGLVAQDSTILFSFERESAYKSG